MKYECHFPNQHEELYHISKAQPYISSLHGLHVPYQWSYFNFLTMFLFFEGGGNILVYPVYLKVQTKGMELEPIKGKPDKVSMRFQDSFAVFSVGVSP